MSTSSNINHKIARLEARVSPNQKNLFQRAATLSGRSLSDFMLSALQEAAKRVIQEHKLIKLTLHDQSLFVQALLNPAEPNAQLRKAVKRQNKSK